MNSLARAALGFSLLSLATGCYACRQDYNPHTGMHYQCRQIGFSLFKKECGRNEGPEFAPGGESCPTCPGEYGGVVEGAYHEGPYYDGPYYEEGGVPSTYYEGAEVIEGTPMPAHPVPASSQPALLPTPADANWHAAPPKAPPVSQTGYQRPVGTRTPQLRSTAPPRLNSHQQVVRP